MDDLFSDSNIFYKQASAFSKIPPLTQTDIQKIQQKAQEQAPSYHSKNMKQYKKQGNYYEYAKKDDIVNFNKDLCFKLNLETLYPPVKNIDIFSQSEIRNNYKSNFKYVQQNKDIQHFIEENKEYMKNEDEF